MNPLPPSWRAGVAAVADEREHGASVLAASALELLERAGAEAPADTAGLLSLAELARALRAARPSMPVIANLVNLAMHDAAAGVRSAGAVVEAAGPAAGRARVRAQEARAHAAREAAQLLRGVVLTHSASETVTKALRMAARDGALRRVVVAEGRPGFEGRGVARALAEEGVEVTLVVDAAMGLHAREADMALVGADAVLADGGIVNKVGTRLLGLACERARTPLYAVADRFKVSNQTQLPLEEKEAREVWPDAPAGVHVRNIYFDRTEAELVARLVTDVGVLAPDEVAPLAREHGGWAGWEARVRALTR